MRKFVLYLMVLLALGTLVVQAQEYVTLGGHRFVPEQNVGARMRGIPDYGASTQGWHNVLVQFSQIPSQDEIRSLAKSGIVLKDYVGGKAYMALVKEKRTRTGISALESAHMVSMVPLRPEWKVDPVLTAGSIPQYAQTASGHAKVVIHLASNAPWSDAPSALTRVGVEDLHVSELLGWVTGQVPLNRMTEVAALPWVVRVALQDPPAKANNQGGATLGRASILNRSTLLGGRGLLGEGQRIGIWDGNVVFHPDFGDRIHVQEYELADGTETHGTHVAGSVLGAGLIDPDARGMAPKAQAWTYNFNVQSNRKRAEEEMAEAFKMFGIHLTQNSYGITLGAGCDFYTDLPYIQSDYAVDKLAVDYPTLSHVYAAGNEQGYCQEDAIQAYGMPGYGTATRKAKNVINVAATDVYGRITDFSSFGPLDDGRLFPTVAARGAAVYSTQPGGQYKAMDGTSMACPTVTGHLALVSERYGQLHNGVPIRNDLLRALAANTADDAGRKGPDFQFGYGILNAERAVIAIEKGYYELGEIAKGDTWTKKVSVPKGAAGFRAMLVWNDPVASREYKRGEKVMINDLDLHLKCGSSDFLPWVLDHTKGNVEKEAKRKKDDLNNIEQVTLTASELSGNTDVVLEVKGSTVVDGKQPFAVVWWVDDDTPRIVTPSAGDKLVAGASTMLRIEHMKAPLTVEISYDGGKNYQQLGSVSTSFTDIMFRIPSNAPITEQAMLRIIDAAGRVVLSEGMFTVAPQPTLVRIEKPDCGLEGWKLVWDKIPAATHGYEVLLANRIEGQYESVGHTEKADETEFTIPAEKLNRGERPVVSVAVRTEHGYGKRAVAMRAEAAMPLKLTIDKLPFAETFKHSGSEYLRISGGENTLRFLRENKQMTDGSNYLYVGVGRTNPQFDSSDFFGEKNRDNMTTISLCDIDLSDLPKDMQVEFRMRGGLVLSRRDDLQSTRFRVYDNGVLLKDQYGKEERQGSMQIEDWIYRLDGGQHHSIKIVHVGERVNDMLGLAGIFIEPLQHQPDVSIALATPLKDGANLGLTKVYAKVSNHSSDDVKKVRLVAHLNGEWKLATEVHDLKAKNDRIVPLELDLSTASPLGERKNIRLEVALDGDTNTTNDAIEVTVKNFGKVITHPISKQVGDATIDPFETHVVTGPFFYADNGGTLSNYDLDQIATLKLLPSDPSQRVRIRFKSFNLRGDSTALMLYTAQVPENLVTAGIPPKAVLQGELPEDARTYVSEAEDGAITLFFTSDQELDGEGWLAEVDLVPARTPLTLVKAEARLTGTDSKAKVPVKVTVRNNWIEEQKGFDLGLWDGRKYILKQHVDQIAQGEKEFTFTEPLELEMSTILNLRVAVLSSPTCGSTNYLPLLAAYDSYCIPGAIRSDQDLFIGTIRVNDSLFTMDDPTTHLQYEVSPTVPIFHNDEKVRMRMKATNYLEHEAQFVVWVDWDGDLKFADSERYSIVLADGEEECALEIPIPTGATIGKKRVRMALLADAKTIADGPCFAGGIETGDLRDITFEMVATNPVTNDLALTGIDAGPSGPGLKTNQEISIRLKNLSNHEFKGKVKVKVKVDDKAEIEDEVDCQSEPLEAFVGENSYKLPTAALDLSASGRHTIKVTIEELPQVKNPENNSMTTEVHCVTPNAAGDQYALAFTSRYSTDLQQVELPQISQALASYKAEDKFTFEFLFNADQFQYGRLLEANGFAIAALNGVGDDVPDNSIGVLVGSYMLAHTPGNVIKPGVWQHVAVELEIERMPSALESGKTNVKIFLDGKEQEVSSYGLSNPDFGNLKLGRKFLGKIDEVRIWKSGVDQAALESHLYTHHRQANGDLPANCLAEFSFDEGPGNTSGISNGMPAPIRVDKADLITRPEGGIWYKQDQLLARFAFTGQVSYTKVGNTYTVKFVHTAKPESIEGTITPAWPDAKLTHQGQPIAGSHTFNFTNDVVVEAECMLFGKKVTQTLTFKFQNDLSNERNLLSLALSKAHNDGLKQDVQVDPVSQVNVIRLREAEGTPTTPAAMKLSFSLPAGATAQYNGVALESNVTPVDFTKPVVVTVKAANGQTKRYDLRLALDQSITWDKAPLAYTYGDAPADLDAVASSGRPVVYVSSNPVVASVANGRLVIGRPGKAELRAAEAGGGLYASAEDVVRTVTVGKKSITVQPSNTQARYAEPVRWQFSYSGLAQSEDEAALPSPLSRKAYTLEDASGHSFDANTLLPVGTYKVKAQSEAYETERYIIQPKDGNLEVQPGDLIDFRFLVADADGPVADAMVKVDGNGRLTSSDGEVIFQLREGLSVSYEVSKAGYGLEKGSAKAETGKDNRISVMLRKADLTLTYKAGDHGTLHGPSTQVLVAGAAGQPVRIEPEAGFRFTRWSDGSLDNPRQDCDVVASLTVTAEYLPAEYTLSYAVVGSGRWKQGKQEQIVSHGANAQTVAVGLADAESFFAGWSDGSMELERTDEKLTSSQIYRAYFGRYATLPASNDFEQGQLSDGWYSASINGNIGPWTVDNFLPSKLHRLDGHFAFCDNRKAPGAGVHHTSHLYSPRFKVSGVTRPIAVSFDYTLQGGTDPDECVVEYTVDGSSWKKLGMSMAVTYERSSWKEELAASEFTGKEFVQFRWVYHTNWGRYVLIDNVQIFETGDAQHTLSYVAEPSEGGSFLVGGVAASSQTVEHGKSAEPVQAQPKANYRFLEWKGLNAEATLQLKAPVLSDMTYTALFASQSTVRIQYVAKPTGRGQFTVDGATVDHQDLERAADAKPVVASPVPGWQFAYWAIDGSGSAERIERAVADDMVLEAVFVPVRRQITFVVVDGQTPIANAIIGVEGQLLQTDASGKASLMLPAGTYAYSVTRLGYNPVQGVCTLEDKDLEVRVDVSQRQVLFVVSTSEGRLPSATVTIEGLQPLTTSDRGEAAITLADGNYKYSASAAGMATVEGDLRVLGRPLRVDVLLTAAATTYEVTIADASNGKVEVRAQGKTLTSGSRVEANTELTISATPLDAKRHRLAKLLVGGQDLTKDAQGGTVRFVVTADVAIEATFEAIPAEKPAPSPTEVRNHSLELVSAHPNPFTGLVTVSGLEVAKRMQLLSVNGVALRTVYLHGEAEVQLDLADLPAGLYVLVVERESARKVLRLVKN